MSNQKYPFVVLHRFPDDLRSEKEMIRVVSVHEESGRFFLSHRTSRRCRISHPPIFFEIGIFDSMAKAMESFDYHVRMYKKNDGYFDISEVPYQKAVIMRKIPTVRLSDPPISNFLKKYCRIDVDNADSVSPDPGNAKKETHPEEVVCVDNTSIEDRFDMGIAYLADPTQYDGTMMFVHDKYGNGGFHFAWRFKAAEVLA